MGSSKNLEQQSELPDWRQISEGAEVPLYGFYTDQPYMALADDGALVVVCTISASPEGKIGQHVVSIRSPDGGKNWENPVEIEPPDGVEASWVLICKAHGERLYAFYTHNTDDIREVPGDKDFFPDGICRDMGALGHYVFKYSDDHGKSWSKRRHDIPVREFEIDRTNSIKGEIRYFWTCVRPFVHDDSVFLPLYKVGGFGKGFFKTSEGALVRSDNLLIESDPEKIHFETLPDGDIGIRAPDGGGPNGEEHSFVTLSDGSFFCVFRTISGYPACSYSRDRGRTWSTSEFLTYPDGRRIKNPRAANFIWKLSGERYLYWFHNHGGSFIAGSEPEGPPVDPYSDRNPAWCLGAREVAGPDGLKLSFSQPEILFYDDDVCVRTSYPDCLEIGSAVLISETDKNKPRLHRIPQEFLNKLFSDSLPNIDNSHLLLSCEEGGKQLLMPDLLPFRKRTTGHYRSFDCRSGFTMCFEVFHSDAGAILLDNLTASGRGWRLSLTGNGVLKLMLSDSQTTSVHRSEKGLIQPQKTYQVGIIVDGGPKIVSFVIDGRFCDGGESRQFGWSRFSPMLCNVAGHRFLSISSSIRNLRIFNIALMTREVIGLQSKQA